MPLTEIGAPSSSIGLGSGRGGSDPLSEKNCFASLRTRACSGQEYSWQDADSTTKRSIASFGS